MVYGIIAQLSKLVSYCINDLISVSQRPIDLSNSLDNIHPTSFSTIYRALYAFRHHLRNWIETPRDIEFGCRRFYDEFESGSDSFGRVGEGH